MPRPPVLILRRPRREDWSTVHEWASDERVCRYQAWGPNTLEQTQDFVNEIAALWNVPTEDRRRLAWIAEIEDEVVVGVGELKIHSAAHGQGEISYAVHPGHWRRGVGTALAARLLDHGFDTYGLHRIFATCDPRNLGSSGVLRAVGMQYEGRLRHTLLIRDGWRDSDIYGILDAEWRRREGASPSATPTEENLRASPSRSRRY